LLLTTRLISDHIVVKGQPDTCQVLALCRSDTAQTPNKNERVKRILIMGQTIWSLRMGGGHSGYGHRQLIDVMLGMVIADVLRSCGEWSLAEDSRGGIKRIGKCGDNKCGFNDRSIGPETVDRLQHPTQH
jgi:hypothetical protein